MTIAPGQLPDVPAPPNIRGGVDPETFVPPEGGWIRKMLPFVKARKADLGLLFICAIVGQGIMAALPLLQRTILDDAIIDRTRALMPLLMVMIALAVLRYGVGFARRFFGARVSMLIEYDLRNVVYDHLQRLDFARHDEMQTGQLVSRANSDVRMVQGLFGQLLPTVSAEAIFFVIALGAMFMLSPQLTIVALIMVPTLVYLSMRMRRVVYPSSWDAQAKDAEVAVVVEEAITGVRIVKGFGQERRELRRLIDAAGNLFGARMRNVRISAKRQATMRTIPYMGQLAVFAYGGWLVIQGDITIGTFLAFQTYLILMVMPVQIFSQMLVMAQNTRAAVERIFEVLESTPTVTEKPDAVELDEIRGEIVFDNVTFGYMRSEPVVQDFDLHVRPGEVVALVGGSGSGKSTCALLLPRFYDVQEGSVRVDGVDIRDAKIDSLRRQIGVVFEESFLFSDTVRSNIAYGHPDATDEEVIAAAKAAEAHDFILQLPDGYDTVVGERGLTLSGGQRQRVALARALITDPRVLILDDATSSIDAKIEEQIYDTLRRIMPGRSVLLIAHRRSTLDLAHRIVVVDRGRVIDTGTHDELFARCKHYRELLAGPEGSAEGTGQGGWDGQRTASAWRVPEEPELPSGDGAAAPAGGMAGMFAGMAGAFGGGAGGVGGMPGGMAGIGMRMGGGGGGGGGAGARRRMMQAPPTAELAEAIANLPPVRDEPDVDTSRETSLMRDFRLPTFLRPFIGLLIISAVLVAIEAVVNTPGPYIMRWGIDHGMLAANPGFLWMACGIFAASVIATRVLAYVVSVYTGRVFQRLLFALRMRVFSQLQRLGIDYYEREMGGRVMTRMTSDINTISRLFQRGLVSGVMNVVTFVFVTGILISMNWALALLVLLSAPPLLLATHIYRKRSDVAYLMSRERLATVNASFQESISGVRVSQAFVRERRNMADFRGVTGDYLQARLKAQRIAAAYLPFVEMLSQVTTVMVIGFGAQFVWQGTLSTGGFIAFVLYIPTIFRPLQSMTQLLDAWQEAKVALGKIRELMTFDIATPEAEQAVEPGRLVGEIRFEDVRFRYRSTTQEALSGVSFEISPGETVALVGETGAGKSTVVKLVARFYDPTEGRVLIDGRDLRDIDLEAFRKQLGYVPQEPFLFSGSIRDNIAYGRPDATDEDVESASRAVGAHDFIERLQYGYNEPVTERGRSLSAGQRQLIALARALLVNPAILLLDEATANLDLATEARVTRAMGVLSEGRTTILIAHRLQTAQRADRILVVHDGRIVEQGSHSELLAGGGRYAELYSSFAMQSSSEVEHT